MMRCKCKHCGHFYSAYENQLDDQAEQAYREEKSRRLEAMNQAMSEGAAMLENKRRQQMHSSINHSSAELPEFSRLKHNLHALEDLQLGANPNAVQASGASTDSQLPALSSSLPADEHTDFIAMAKAQIERDRILLMQEKQRVEEEQLTVQKERLALEKKMLEIERKKWMEAANESAIPTLNVISPKPTQKEPATLNED